MPEPAATQDIIYITGFVIFLVFTVIGFKLKESSMVMIAGLIGVIFSLWLIITYSDAMVGLIVFAPAILVTVIGSLNMYYEYA